MQQWLASFRDGLAKTRNNLAGHWNALIGRQLVDDEFWIELEETLICGRFRGHHHRKDRRRSSKSPRSSRTCKSRATSSEFSSADVGDYLTPPKDRASAEPAPNRTSCSSSGSTGRERPPPSASWPPKSGSTAMQCCSSPAIRFAPRPPTNWPSGRKRAGAEIVRHKEGRGSGGGRLRRPGRGKSPRHDVVFIDTAGRLQTKHNLMEELKKIRRIIAREVEGAPHETLLVLDASTGQNALSQARLFHEATEVTGIVLTKLDGTAKGGIIVAIMDQVDLPVKYVGFGEKVDQLKAFDPRSYVDALF